MDRPPIEVADLDLPPGSAGWIIRQSYSVRGFLRLAPRFALRQTKEEVAAHIPRASDTPARCAASPH